MTKPTASASRPREGGGTQRMSNSLVALSSAVVLTVYAAGYWRTQAAANRFATEADQRRPVPPMPQTAETPAAWPTLAPAPSATPAAPAAVGSGTAPTTTATTPAPVAVAAKPAPSDPPVAPVVSSTAASSSQAAAPTMTTTADTLAASLPTGSAAAPPAAVATIATPAAPPAPARPRYKDGTFTGWGTSRHGDIQAQVIVADGRITSATIIQCMTRWPCSWIEALPGQVVTRQSPETDYVSGATQSTNAFYYAVVQALGKAVAE